MKERLSRDVVFGLASRAADNARIWLVLGGLLAAAGRRFGRRAASRGLLALGAVEVGTAALKPVIGRRRPRRRLGALLARKTSPSTSSFPSSHAAAGFAFATGAALELPILAAPLGVLAAFVAWSRVETGHHHTGDVVAGAGLGVAIGLATKRVWPVAPHAPAAAHPAGFDNAGMPGSSITVVVNPSAGPPLSMGPADRLRKELPTADVVAVDEPDDLPRALRQAADRSDVIGVSGGDGSVNQAAAIAHEADKHLLVVPGGTLNHFAHALGIESVDDAVAAASGRAVAVDLGRIADRIFLNVASFGVYTDLVDARERLERHVGKWPALLVALIRVLRGAEPLELEIDGEHRRVWMAFVGNCRYHPSGFAPSWRERLDDGVLDIRLVDAASPWSRTRLVLAVLTGRLGRSRVYQSNTAREIHIRSLNGTVRLAADGEVFDGPAEFVIAKDDRPLTVLVPSG